MRPTSLVHLAVWSAWLGACSSSDQGGSGPSSPTGSLRVIQAAESTAALDVLVDDSVAITALGSGTLSSPVALSVGQRTLTFRPVGGAISPHQLELLVAADSQYTAIVIDSSTVLNPMELTDSGAVPAAGKTKLRVVNFAEVAGPINVYRRQPDFDGLVSVAFPFPYRLASPYLQSDPGNWQVLVATESNPGGPPPDEPLDTLLIVDPIPLAAGGVVTVTLLDRPGGGVDAVLLQDR
jgi:Domain of unknown function (DUF4397)